MYTREIFGQQLKKKITNKIKIRDIGHWTYSVYLNHIDDIDDEFRGILLALNTMENGPEFELPYEELDKIADDLIAGKEVKL